MLCCDSIHVSFAKSYQNEITCDKVFTNIEWMIFIPRHGVFLIITLYTDFNIKVFCASDRCMFMFMISFLLQVSVNLL